MISDEQYIAYIKNIHKKIGFRNSAGYSKNLSFQPEPEILAFVELDCFGRMQRMEPTAVSAWKKMKTSAAKEGVVLNIISAFRSIQDQFYIFEKKLNKNISLDEILKVNMPPGYSEHHTGMAVDISDGENNDLTEKFETTEAFAWLKKNANRFHFMLSYPRNNAWNVLYEPWHWKFTPDA